jgi:outer membrane receptor protein involved in Fe transport
VDAGGGRTLARATLYWMEVSDPVTSVTLSATPDVITRQRRNLGETRTRGVEVDAEAPLWPGATLAAGYAFADAVVTEAADPSLVGLAVPAGPAPPGDAEVARRRRAPVGRRRGALRLRAVRRRPQPAPLSSFATMDLTASLPLGAGLEAFVACENVTDVRYEVGRTPIPTVAPGRLIRGGVRLKLGR